MIGGVPFGKINQLSADLATIMSQGVGGSDLLNIETQLNLAVSAGTAAEFDVTAVITTPKIYAIVIANVSHSFGVRAKRLISITGTFGAEIDTVDLISEGNYVSIIGEVVEFYAQKAKLVITNNDTVNHNYDVVIMGVA